jgi:UDP-N-acetylmuramoyl-tripeptide--D-alanyl-D-alanine ligase
MHELGASSSQAHEKIGTLARDLGIDHLVAINATEYGASLNYENWENALSLMSEMTPGDVVLVKASRAEGLERLADALVAGWER